MTLKTARNGKTKGQQFWGCAKFPKCWYSLSYQPSPEPPSPHSPPTCGRCSSPMKLRTAGKGQYKGQQFWGCATYPKCRFKRPYFPTAKPERNSATAPRPVSDVPEATEVKPEESQPPNKLWMTITEVVLFIERIRSWYLELREPDANGSWPDRHHRKVLRFIWERDARRCGLCGGRIKKLHASSPTQRPQIEHIVPKVFAVFDLDKDGKARPGTDYKSRLHKMNNLQAAHSYCNKRKGNTTDISRWRHPSLRRLPVARSTADGERLFLPDRE